MIPLRRLDPLLAHAREGGVNIDAMLHTLALEHLSGRLPPTFPVALADYYRIQNHIALALGDETCQLSARQLLPGSTDFVLRNLGQAGSLFDAMRAIAQSYNLLHGGNYNFVERRDDTIDYVIDDRTFPYRLAGGPEEMFFSIECTLIFLSAMLDVVAPGVVARANTGLALRRPRGAEDCHHLDVWHVPIRFGAERYRLSLKKRDALAVLAPPRPETLSSHAVYLNIVRMVEAAAQHAHRQRDPAFAKDVRAVLARMAGQGHVGQDEVASVMHMSVATLRRRLAEDGLQFRDLKQQALNSQARAMLAAGHPVGDVAETLGFAEPRSFNRAFKAWNDITPRQFQKKQS